MAITTLAELKTAVQNWRDRQDAAFTDRTGEFVSLAEARLNDMVPVRLAEGDTTLTGTVDSRSISLPSDFLEPIALFRTTGGDQYQLAPVIAGTYELNTTSGWPEAWMINGSNIDLDKPCDQAHTFLFRYRKRLFDLATTDPNWLLTNHPDVYLFATLVEACGFEGDDTGFALYEARLQKAMRRVRWVEARSKSIANLRVDAALATGGGAYNINSDSFGAF